MKYDHCKHGRIRIPGLVFWCNNCVREDERNRILRALNYFSVNAPKKSRAATFTPEQFRQVVESPIEEIDSSPFLTK